jgi:hypothetical protein
MMGMRNAMQHDGNGDHYRIRRIYRLEVTRKRKVEVWSVNTM